ncbi:hypothetical protein OS493_028751 [Desmophyllum pertusum]|uniref:Uncharacterized protein n=1 Tax=Desmophyllum pertusum TaxID=174260 RepID=A0A9X0CF62_9CNID|nr:hypothetical protein OS493_028751 [Desmophyllum pertusum]
MLQLKDAMLNYDFQSCPRIKKESFKDLEVDDIEFIRIALIGPTGSGKTSFVAYQLYTNHGAQYFYILRKFCVDVLARYSELLESRRVPFEQGTGNKAPFTLKNISYRIKIRMVDTRGFYDSDERLMDEYLKIMSGRYKFVRVVKGAEFRSTCRWFEYNSAFVLCSYLCKNITRVTVPLFARVSQQANDPRMRDKSKYKDALQKIREALPSYAPVAVITNLDRLTDKEDKDEAFGRGVPGQRVASGEENLLHCKLRKRGWRSRPL